MEVVTAVGICLSVPLIYSFVRPRWKATVNCWFCNKNTKVNYNNRNCFICPHCEQYNGFTTDGDYNRRIPEQSHSSQQTRYCTPAPKLKSTRTEDRFSGLNMSPKGDNGLCSDCNRNQEIIMRKVADFEPIDEDRWNEELEDYRYKLERMYQLCPRCTLAVHGKLEDDKKKYSYLFEIKHRLKSAIGSTINQLVNPSANRSRRFFFAGGTTSECFRVATLLVSILMFFSNIEFLQQDTKNSLIEFPLISKSLLAFTYTASLYIHLLIITTHIFACKFNLCRVTLPDLLIPIIVTLSLLTFAIESETSTQDTALIRCACSSFITILATAGTFIPRKMLHKKKPNRIITSAFSVASTPTSQCSSQASRNASPLERNSPRNRYLNKSPVIQKSPVSSSPTIRRNPFESNQYNISNGSTSPKMAWREREASPIDPLRTRMLKKENRGEEAMDWDDDESVAMKSTVSHFAPSLLAKSGVFGRNEERESTPARLLAPSVASMSLFNDGNDDEVQSSLSFRTAKNPFETPGAARSVFSRTKTVIQSPTRSIFAPPRSGFAQSEPRYSPDFQHHSGSVFTSVSQQDRNSQIGGAWQCRILMVLFALIFIVLIFQIILFYILLRK